MGNVAAIAPIGQVEVRRCSPLSLAPDTHIGTRRELEAVTSTPDTRIGIARSLEAVALAPDSHIGTAHSRAAACHLLGGGHPNQQIT